MTDTVTVVRDERPVVLVDGEGRIEVQSSESGLSLAEAEAVFITEAEAAATYVDTATADTTYSKKNPRILYMRDYLPPNHNYGTDLATTYLQDAIDDADAAGNAIIIFDGLTYRLNGSIEPPAGVRYKGAGLDTTILRFDDDTANPGFYYTGEAYNTLALRADTVEGSNVISVANMSGGTLFAVGETIELYSNQWWPSDIPGGIMKSNFISKVQAINTTPGSMTITIEDPIPFVYKVAWDDHVRRYPNGLREGVSFEDMTIEIEDYASYTTNTRTFVLRLHSYLNLGFKNVRFRGSSNCAFIVQSSRNVIVDSCHIEYAQDGPTVLFCTHVQFHNCYSRGQGTGFYCQNVIHFSYSDCHMFGREIINDAGTMSNAGGRGMKVAQGCMYGTITGGTITGFDTGIYLQDCSYVAVDSVTIFRVYAHGVSISGYTDRYADTPIGHHTITNLILRRIGGAAVYVGGGRDAGYCTVSDCLFEDSTCFGVALMAMYINSSHNVIEGNTFKKYINNYGVYVSDQAVGASATINTGGPYVLNRTSPITITCTGSIAAFPASGTATAGAVSFAYTGKSGNSFTGCTGIGTVANSATVTYLVAGTTANNRIADNQFDNNKVGLAIYTLAATGGQSIGANDLNAQHGSHGESVGYHARDWLDDHPRTYEGDAFGGTFTPDAGRWNIYICSFDSTSETGTLNAPTNPTKGAKITFLFRNPQAGPHVGAITWNAAYILTGGPLPSTPVGGFQSITFIYDGYYDNVWKELSRSVPPVADYTVTNVTTDRTYNANATTLDEIADVLGTLIADLTTAGILT
jgi:hypothetical protein